MTGFVVPLLLIVLQGLFTASETALMTIERTRLGRARQDHQRWAIRAQGFLAAPERFFSTILVCEDFLLVIASTIFAQYFLGRFGTHSIIFSTLILSFFSLVVGQYLPKSVALAAPEKVLAIFGEGLYLLEYLLAPAIILFSSFAKRAAALLRAGRRADLIRHSDIVFALGEHEKEASKLATRLFNFSRRSIADVMIPLDAAYLCRRSEELKACSESQVRLFTRLPVYEGERKNVIGIFNVKDYLYGDKFSIRPPFHVRIDDRCMPVFLTMKERGEHIAIVDEGGEAVGIVTLEDLIEELVGEIRDEK